MNSIVSTVCKTTRQGAQTNARINSFIHLKTNFNTRLASLATTLATASAVLLLSACGTTAPDTAASATPARTNANAGVSTSVGVGSGGMLSAQQISAIVANPDRSAADRDSDPQRRPEHVLAFIGIRPGMVALDLSAAGGYTTELLARAVGPNGRVYGQSPPPRDAHSAPQQAAVPEGNSAPPVRSPARAAGNAAPAATTAKPAAPTVHLMSPQALAARISANTALANIVPVVQPFEDPVPRQLAAGGLDVVTLMFNYHDLGHWGVDRAQMNRRLFAALKPGGVYVIADHAGRPGTGISESGTLHRIEEAFLRNEVEAAGFKQVDEGFFLRNPSDPRDKNTPEPPQPKDGFILKFVKP